MKKEKRELRQQIRDRLMGMDHSVYMERSANIHQRLFNTEEWKGAEVIGITLSIFPEVDTYGVIEKAWEYGKRVAVPKCLPEKKGLKFFLITDFNQVQKGYYGLYEPVEEKGKEVKKEQIQFLVVPGVVFSKKGNRIGFGGGYYDRFLQGYDGVTLSMAFEEQIVGDVPVEDHDKRVGMIVTERNVYYCNGN